MILAALRQKFASRGAIGFAADAVELSGACAVVGACSFAMAGAAIAVAVVGTPLLALDLLARPDGLPPSTDEKTSCRNAEEAYPLPLGHAFLPAPDGVDWCDFNVGTDEYRCCSRRSVDHGAAS